MPNAITAYAGGASFQIGVSGPGPGPPEPEQARPGDTVDVSGPDGPAATYGPNDVVDRFRFDIQNGMFDRRLRYTALRTRFPGAAARTYEARSSLGARVTGGGVYGALFALQYADAQPDPDQASTSVEARSELDRMAEQRLSLLNSL